MNRVTLDSNIYLSALVFGGKPQQLLEMAVQGEIEVAISDPILAEIRRHLTGKFGWSDERAADALETILSFAKHVTPTETLIVVPRDRDDDRIVECAVAGRSEVIVTGDNDLLSLGSFRGIRIQRAAEFLTDGRSR